MMRTCSSYDVTRHENGGTKIRTEVGKYPKIATLEGYKICLNWPILILFLILKSGEYVLANKQIRKGSKISFQ